jgi:PAS domain-containing protein
VAWTGSYGLFQANPLGRFQRVSRNYSSFLGVEPRELERMDETGERWFPPIVDVKIQARAVGSAGPDVSHTTESRLRASEGYRQKAIQPFEIRLDSVTEVASTWRFSASQLRLGIAQGLDVDDECQPIRRHARSRSTGHGSTRRGSAG